MSDQELQNFKDGTYDALMYGIRSETNKSHHYKQGYDFGLVLHSDQIDMFYNHKHGDTKWKTTNNRLNLCMRNY